MKMKAPDVARGVLVAAMALAGTQAAAVGQDASEDGLLPVGYGRLNQDDLSVGMRAGNLDIRLTVLQETGLRLLNKESYESLHRLVESKRAQIDSVDQVYGLGDPGLLMVRYYSLAEGSRFDAQLLTTIINGQFYTPVAIIPLTTSIQSDRLGRRQQAAGIYVFEETLTPYLPMVFSYGAFRADGWNSDRVRSLQRERSRIQSRVMQQREQSSQEEPAPEDP